MDLLIIWVLFFSASSFSSLIIEPSRSIFSEFSIDRNFISLINEPKYRFESREHLEHDPIVFGNASLFSIFNNLVQMVLSFYSSPVSAEKEEEIDLLIVKNYYPLVKYYHKTHTIDFLYFLGEADILFLIFVHNIETANLPNKSFIRLIKSILGIVGAARITSEQLYTTDRIIENIYSDKIALKTPLVVTKKLVFQSISTNFTKKHLDDLFEKKLISPDDWAKQKDIAKQYLLLHKVSEFFYDHNDPSLKFSYRGEVPSSRIPFERDIYMYIIDNFSIVNGNEIDFTHCRSVYKKLRRGSMFCSDIKKRKRLYAIFYLYSCILCKKAFSQIKDESQLRLKFLCLVIISRQEKDFEKMRDLFTYSFESLLPKAISVIRMEVENVVKEMASRWPMINNSIKIDTKQDIYSFLEKCLNEDFDQFGVFNYWSKWEIKIYLRAMKFDSVYQYLLSFFKKLTDRAIQSQLSLLISGNNPNHLFIELIEGFKPLSSRKGIDRNQNDPVIFGDNSLVSIFYDLMDISKFVPQYLHLYNWEKENFNKLVKTLYYPLIQEFYKLNMSSFIQLLAESGFSFQMITIEALGSENSSPLFMDSVYYLKKIKREECRKKKKYDFYSELELIKSAIRFATGAMMEILRKPLIVPDWGERREIIRLHFDLLSKIDFAFNDKELLTEFNTRISLEIEKYEFLLDNFSITDGNQIDFQKFQKITKNVFDLSYNSIPWDELIVSRVSKPPTPENIHLLLLLYSNHYIDSFHIQKQRFQIDIEFLCMIVYLRTLACLQPSLNKYLWKSPIIEARKTLGDEISKILLSLAPECPLIKVFIQNRMVSIYSLEAITFLTNYVNGEYDTKYKSLLRLNKGLTSVFLILASFDKIDLALL
jgi:hypothetical protein